MGKDQIKKILREHLTEGSNNKKKFEKDYASIQSALLSSTSILTQSQVMQAAGLGSADDATARSLFSKKLNKEKNEEGGRYLFDELDLAKIVKVVNNPKSYIK